MAGSNFTFVYMAPDARFPNTCGWYRAISDFLQLLDHHEHYTQSYAHQQLKDPHNKMNCREVADRLTRRFQAMQKAMTEHGVIYINHRGGWIFGGESVVVKHTLTKQDSSFQVETVDPADRIYITRHAGCPHWYLRSGLNRRIFEPAKYNSLEAAKAEASKYVLPDRIEVKDNWLVGRRDGD